MQDTLGAIIDISKAIDFDPDNIELFLTRGHYYFGMNNFKKAIEDYNVYLINERNNYIAFIKRGEAYAALEIYGAAIEDYSSAIKLNNNDSRLFFDRGIFYLENKDFEDKISGINPPKRATLQRKNRRLSQKLQRVTSMYNLRFCC